MQVQTKKLHFGVDGSGASIGVYWRELRVDGSGLRGQGLQFRVSGFGFRVSGFGFRVKGFGVYG